MPQDGPWTDRVVFDGGTAFVPGRVIVRAGQEEAARALLRRTGLFRDEPPPGGPSPEATDDVRQSSSREESRRWFSKRGEGRADEAGPGESAAAAAPPDPSEQFSAIDRVTDPLAAVRLLNLDGLDAQPDHVLFADCCCSCSSGCPPHPAAVAANPYGANPYGANPYGANPYGANPYGANPYGANPYGANPYGANAGGGCGCGGASADPYGANPYGANPYGANPYGANARRADRTGRRRSTARPAEGVPLTEGQSGITVAILDTGWPEDAHVPAAAAALAAERHEGDAPDRPDGDEDGFLDPVAGHGLFIGGVIGRLAPGVRLRQRRVLGGYGDGAEWEVATALLALAGLPDDRRPHLVNLSFGAYTPFRLLLLQHAVNALLDRGVIVVASAGNDATCVPSYPAALPGVIGVGALTGAAGHRRPAPFTNYGPWVSASAPGVDVISTFFAYDGAEAAGPGGRDPDRFDGWARWSGTSFAAPYVVGRLAAHLADRGEPAPTDRGQALAAVREVIPDDADRHIPWLGIRVD